MTERKVYTATAVAETTVLPQHEWEKRLITLKEEGNRIASDFRAQGHRIVPKVLAPRESLPGDTLAAVVIHLDWTIATRLAMVESANDFLTKARVLGPIHRALPTVLRMMIEGKGLYEYSLGEFFQLYGRFEGKYQLTNGKQTLAKMRAMVNGDMACMKQYVERGQSHWYPLPYAVRNILAHTASNRNTLDPQGKELELSIELLRSWVALPE